MTDLPRRKSDVYERGTWSLFLADEAGDNPHYSANLCCPVCGDIFSIVNHTISPDGRVSPSVQHPATKHGADCGWHPTPRLLDWPNLPNPAPMSFATCSHCDKQSRSIGGWGTDARYPKGIVCSDCFNAAREAWASRAVPATGGTE
jgi:hypothetical protein